MKFKPYSAVANAHRMPDDLAETLVRTVNELREQSSALAENTRQETELRSQFQTDIERYRELHTLHAH
jgi:multidrug resistance efflux pump